MKKIYLYPITSRNYTGINNPYISLLASALSEKYHVINQNHPSNKGIMDLLKYLKKVDIVYLNWIEDLPGKYMGILQSMFFFPLLKYLKLKNKTVIWTLHNKRSHSGDHLFWKKRLFNLMRKHSDFVITHSEEGLKHIPSATPCFYIPHPVKETSHTFTPDEKEEYDIIIWGTIAKYKGVDEFLNYLRKINKLKDYRVLIAGKITDKDLEIHLNQINREYQNIRVINKFVEESDLHRLILRSKIILFTYHSDSVLSSGALMDSLIYRKIIIGPHTGAFKDLENEGLIYTFRDFRNLTDLLEELKEKPGLDEHKKQNIATFCKDNSWRSFSEKFQHALKASL